MKKVYIILIGIVSFFGCSSELDLIPLNTVTEPTFWKTADDAITGLNGVYNTLADNDLYRDFFMHSDALSNNAFSHNSFVNYLEISEGAGFDSNSPLPRAVWNRNYEGIVRANRVVENVASIAMDNTLKNRIVAEARFLRGLFYFNLTNLYGDVPLLLNVQNISESLVPRNPKSEVVTQIVEDLTFAIANLPPSYTATDQGRVTRGAATALKCRVHLYNGQYADAISAANSVSAMGYDLVTATDFPNMFLPTLENNNPESIFEIQFLSATGVENVGSFFNSQSDALLEFGSSTFAPLQELVAIYDPTDIRLPATIIQVGDDFGGELYGGTNSQTGYCYKKYVIPNPVVTNDGDANYIVLRYAEVLLNLAEAENELNGPSGAYAPINKIRNRAGLTDLPAGLTSDQMRDAIKLERRMELAFEGHHYFDLLRYGSVDLQAAMEDVTSVAGHDRVFEPRFTLWPIPQQEINVNPNLTQNSGW